MSGTTGAGVTMGAALCCTTGGALTAEASMIGAGVRGVEEHPASTTAMLAAAASVMLAMAALDRGPTTPVRINTNLPLLFRFDLVRARAVARRTEVCRNSPEAPCLPSFTSREHKTLHMPHDARDVKPHAVLSGSPAFCAVAGIQPIRPDSPATKLDRSAVHPRIASAKLSAA
jgi:hypothetical protein